MTKREENPTAMRRLSTDSMPLALRRRLRSLARGVAPSQPSLRRLAEVAATPFRMTSKAPAALMPLATTAAARPRSTTSGLAAVLLLATLTPAAATAEKALTEVPDPLSLEQALGFAEGHPRVRVERASAGIARQLPRAQPLYLGCHSLAFSGARSNDAARDVAWFGLLSSTDAQRLEIMQRFFDVLLADLSFARDNEAMAVAFIQFDRAEARLQRRRSRRDAPSGGDRGALDLRGGAAARLARGRRPCSR